jgi:hypothetical protein
MHMIMHGRAGSVRRPHAIRGMIVPTRTSSFLESVIVSSFSSE